MPTVGIQYLPRILQEYSARHPENRVVILDHASRGVADAVLRARGRVRHPDRGAAPSRARRACRCSRTGSSLICRNDHPLAKRTRLPWKELEPHPLILAGEVSGNRPLLDAAPADHGASACTRSTKCSAARPRSGSSRRASAPRSCRASRCRRAPIRAIRVVALTDPVVSRTLVLISRKAGAPLARRAGALRHHPPQFGSEPEGPAGRLILKLAGTLQVVIPPALCYPALHPNSMEESMRNLIGALCLALLCSPAVAADAKKDDAPKVQQAPKATAQQDKAKTAKCDKDASAKGLKGDERKAFMSKCLQW